MLVSYAITNLAWYVSIVGIDIIVGAPKALDPALIEFCCFWKILRMTTPTCIVLVNKLIKMFIFSDLDELILQMVILHKTFNNHFLLACKIPNWELH